MGWLKNKRQRAYNLLAPTWLDLLLARWQARRWRKEEERGRREAKEAAHERGEL